MGVRLDAPAPRHWSTREVAQPEALAYWVDTVCGQFLELEIDTPVRDRFHACLAQVDLGPASASFLEADPQHVRRTRAKIARMRTPMFMLMQLRVGQVRFQQMGREVRVGPGECVFIDGTEPYELECPHPTKALALRLPADWLRGWIAQPEHHAARLFNGGGWSSALCAAVASVEIDSYDKLALPADAIADPIATLLKLAIGPESEMTSRQPILLNHLMRTLRNRFHEADLGPMAVAAEHGICTRSVHYAFAKARTTFVERLMELRLGRAHELLSDTQLLDLPVAEVAVRCGFADPSHFARRFRQRFGRSPLQFRAALTRARH
jgi:AraC family transcriptional activator of tynA and feaB